jgi:hypothetical protein
LRRDPLFAAYQGQSASFLVKHLDVSHELSRVLARVFALDPEARPDAASFARMLIVPGTKGRSIIPLLQTCSMPIDIFHGAEGVVHQLVYSSPPAEVSMMPSAAYSWS